METSKYSRILYSRFIAYFGLGNFWTRNKEGKGYFTPKKKALAIAAPGNLILQVKQDLYCKKVKYCSFTLNATYYLLSYLTNKKSGLLLWVRF